MRSTYSNIRKLERDIDRIKMLHGLRKMTSDAAKQEILRLENQLMEHVALLPEHQKRVYLIRKEFGKEF